MVGGDFSGRVVEGKGRDEEVTFKYERKEEGHTVIHFAKMMETAVENTYFKRRDGTRVTLEWQYKACRWTIYLAERCNLKNIGDSKTITG